MDTGIFTLIIGVVVFLILWYLISKARKKNEYAYDWIYELDILGLFLYGVALFLVYGGIYLSVVNTTPVKTEPLITKIVSLERENLTKGRFILGSGTIESVPHYFMYKDLGGSRYKLMWVECNKYILKETNDKPSGIYYNRYYYEALWGLLKEKEDVVEHVIYIPKGTIIREFKP